MKISIIGVGKTGSSVAFAISRLKKVREIVLIDKNKKLARGEAMDLRHSLGSVTMPPAIKSGEYPDVAGSSYIIIAVGARRNPTRPRECLFSQNYQTVATIFATCLAYAPEAYFLLITNPVDLIAEKIGAPQLIPIGTCVDTLRFRAETKCRRVFVRGRHDESMEFIYHHKMKRKPYIEEKVRQMGSTLLQLKGGSNWAVAEAVRRMIE